MEKRPVFFALMVALVAVSGCISGSVSQDQPVMLPIKQGPHPFLYYSYSNYPALAENYAYLDGNTVTFFNRNVFDPEGTARQDTAILVPDVPEVTIDIQPFISLSLSRHPGTGPSESTYLNPDVTGVFFGQRVPAVMVIVSDGATNYMDLYNLDTRETMRSESAAHAESVFCSTISKFALVGKCSPAFNIGPVASYGLITRDGWASAVENLIGLEGRVLSWWDFVPFYRIFAYLDAVPLPHDMGAITETAAFLTAGRGQWDDYAPWLSERGITHILLDYTMPPKYGAIVQMSGEQPRTIESFTYDRLGETDGGATLVFRNNERMLQIPLDSNGDAAGAVRLSEGDRAVYINQMCTKNGLLTIGSEESAVPGCVSMMGNFAYIIPEDVMDTVFANLMFMAGKGLPVEKVFENAYVKLYRIID